MRIFLVYVRDDDYFRLLPPGLKRPRSDGRIEVMAFPPLGIQTLAPVLREAGHDVQMFDTCHPDMTEAHIVEAARQQCPDVFALSFLSTTSYLVLKRMAAALKGVAPRTPVIVGGPFATINAVKILEDCPLIDAVGAGEGEELLPDYLEHLHDPGVVGSLSWRRGREVVENPRRPVLRDLDRFPYPDRKTLPIEYIESMPLDVPAVLSLDRWCTVQTSRGCPYKCIYCDIPWLAEGMWRARSPEHVLGELQQLDDEGYRSVYLTDDHFLLKRKRIEKICHGMIDRGLTLRWGCEGRVDAVAVDQFPLMGRANCRMLAFGIEAGTQHVLDRLNKMQTLEQIEHAITLAKESGIDTAHGFFLVGSPGETEADIMQSFKFAARLKIDTFGFNRLCCYRGTPLWKEYEARGIIDDDRDWHKWFKCSDIDPTVLPSAVVNDARKKGYVWLFLHRIFLRPVATLLLLRRFGKYMKWSDIGKLLWSPFRKHTFTRPPTLTAKMIDAGLSEPQRAKAA
ncbi:MAG: radical SAM protein [Phycisphaeraceae bacterium]|nr:radical SAM protein [Phycisphaeraceae bacterium]